VTNEVALVAAMKAGMREDLEFVHLVDPGARPPPPLLPPVGDP
jgi:hypothetical protein